MTTIQEILAGVRIGAPAAHKNLQVFPILGGTTPHAGYMTLDEAIARSFVRITEISDAGSVPELRLANSGTLPVFIMDGEELIGAKQNRAINLSILAPGGKTIIIPVSCVEQGRWRQNSADFSPSPRIMFSRARAKKQMHVSASLEYQDRRCSDQSEIWADIANAAACMEARSPTAAMSDIFEKHHESVENFVRAFPVRENQTGAVFAVDGAVSGLDLFDSPETLRKLIPKIVRSYALDAIDAGRRHRANPAAADQSAIESFLLDLGSAVTQSYPAIGIGNDIRLSGENLAGAALEADDRVIHLGAFRVEAEGRARLSRPSSRRRNLMM